MDGGVNWSSVQVHPGGGALTDVYFVNELVGWAVGLQGAIFRTADGGATWVSQFTDTTRTFRAVHFTDAAFGWAVGVRVTGVNNTVYKTTNGGSSWTNVSMADPNVFANDVVFTDPNTGFVVGGLSGGQAVVFTTVDGGETWGRQTVSGVTASQFFALAVVSESTGVDGWVVGEGDDQVVAMTLDPYCSAVTTCATDTECAYGDACIATDIPYYHLNRQIMRLRLSAARRFAATEFAGTIEDCDDGNTTDAMIAAIIVLSEMLPRLSSAAFQ